MKIDPCPFCGNEELYCTQHRFRDNGLVYVKCESCGAEGPPEEWEDDAINKWNTRFKEVY